MASLETIGPLIAGMKSRPDMAGLACEALNRMFQKEQTELVAQVKPHPSALHQVIVDVQYTFNQRLSMC